MGGSRTASSGCTQGVHLLASPPESYFGRVRIVAPWAWCYLATDVLDSLDRVPWATLHLAYGSAGDVPSLLRAVANGDEEALDSLFWNVWHQGTVYEATPHVVPFLLELLDAPGASTSTLLSLLHAIATGHSERWKQLCAEVVAGGAERYLDLLDSPDANVRASAAHTLGACVSRASELSPRLATRIASERDDLVRAALVFAIGDLGGASPALLESWLREEHTAQRAAAAVVAVRRDGDCPASVVRALRDEAPRAIDAFRALEAAAPAGDPLTFVLDAVLAGQGRLGLAADLLTGWLRHPSVEARRGAAFAAERALHRYRAAPEHLVPILAASLNDPDPDVRYWVAHHLAASGRATKAAADALWAVLERQPLEHNTPSAFALLGLAKIHDARAMRVVAEHVHSFAPPVVAVLDYVAPPHGDICGLALVRALPTAPAGNTRIALISAIGRFPDLADRAVPLLRTELAEHPHVTTRVLGDWGPHAAAARPDLEAMLTHEISVVRVNAARAVLRMGGDRTRASAILWDAVLADPERPDAWALGVLAEAPDASAAPLFESLLGSDDERISLDAAIGYYRATKDAARVLPILLRHFTSASPKGMAALRCLGEIGRPARGVASALRQSLASELRQNSYGVSDSIVDSDEAWVDACVSTLTRIDAEG